MVKNVDFSIKGELYIQMQTSKIVPLTHTMQKSLLYGLLYM